MYKHGQGVQQDHDEAARWYRLAAEQGNANAQNNLGTMYADGQGVKKDDAEALRWWRKAADQGHAKAQEQLRSMKESKPPDGSPAASFQCANCGVVAGGSAGVDLKPCSRCKSVWYCGTPCQTEHWTTGKHRGICKKSPAAPL